MIEEHSVLVLEDADVAKVVVLAVVSEGEHIFIVILHLDPDTGVRHEVVCGAMGSETIVEHPLRNVVKIIEHGVRLVESQVHILECLNPLEIPFV